MPRKRTEAENTVAELLSERMKSKVIAPYARACASLSNPLSCNGDGIASWGRWVRKTTAAVKTTATISHLVLKMDIVLGLRFQQLDVGDQLNSSWH